MSLIVIKVFQLFFYTFKSRTDGICPRIKYCFPSDWNYCIQPVRLL